MARTYIVAKGDTLARIADRQLGTAALAGGLADYNGLPDANRIFVGQRILLPTAKERRPASGGTRRSLAANPVTAWPSPPHGFRALRDTFGDLPAYLASDGGVDRRWEEERIVRTALPFPIPLAWDTRRNATVIRCHKLVAPLFEEAFRRIAAEGLKRTVKTYGGCYVVRPKRNGIKPSAHSWGIAVDLNPNSNAVGTAGDMDPRLVALFESYGFSWGGRWSGRNRDPMHFQYCSGY